MVFAYLNGEMVNKDSLSVSIDDYGFARGNAVYELTRVYGDEPFKLDEHMNRLMNSLAICNIKQPYSKSDFKRMVIDLIQKNNFSQSVVKVYVTQGVPKTEAWSLNVDENFEPKVMVVHGAYNAYSDGYPLHKKYYTNGICMATVGLERDQPEAKTTNYLNAVIASSNIAKKGYEDMIYINKCGEVTECSRSNIFFVKDGTLITPEFGMLLGVTRKVIIDIARANNIKVEIRSVLKSEILLMDEAFMTGSAVELVPINCIDDTKFD